MEALRDEVRFARTVQPGMKYAALDGDGHAILPPGFYTGRVPERWLSEDGFPKSWAYKGCGFGGEDVYGTASLAIHNYVAAKVKTRGSQARAI